MNDIPKAYYPRRARWYSPMLYAWFRIRRGLLLGRIQLPSGINGYNFVMGLLLPGYAFAAHGQRTLARSIYGGYLVAAIIFVVWLGYFVSSVALATMISLHVSSVLYLVNRQSWMADLRSRLLCALVVFLVIFLGIYRPLQRLFEKWLAMPLQVGNRIVMVNTRPLAGSVKRGDWVVYEINQATGDHMYVASGLGFGRVQAVAGDRIVFGPRSWQVNNEVFPRQRYMPVEKTWVVPEKHWFIWPDSTISNLGDPQQDEAASRLIQQVAMVSEPQYAGKPLRRWFWRRQTLP